MTSKGGLILGIIQGLTEFLPVSSSGHLVLAGKYLNLGAPGLSFSVALHLGTLLSTLVMLRQEIVWLLKGIIRPENADEKGRAFSTVGYLVLASIPAALAGIFFEDKVEELFLSPLYVGGGLLVTGLLLLFFGGVKPEKGKNVSKPFTGINLRAALLMGFFQAIAIIPGISRSGSTISAGLLAGLDREDAASFSFLMASAVISGAALLDILRVSSVRAFFTEPALVGLTAAFLSGLLALSFVVQTLKKGKFRYFGYYCLAIGTLVLFLEIR